LALIDQMVLEAVDLGGMEVGAMVLAVSHDVVAGFVPARQLG
jgi:hypothetical protein